MSLFFFLFFLFLFGFLEDLARDLILQNLNPILEVIPELEDREAPEDIDLIACQEAFLDQFHTLDLYQNRYPKAK